MRIGDGVEHAELVLLGEQPAHEESESLVGAAQGDELRLAVGPGRDVN